MKRIFLALVVLTSFIPDINAQFKDSSWVLTNQITGSYTREKWYETMLTGNPSGSIVGLNRNYSINYSPRIGKYKKKRMTFFGIEVEIAHRQGLYLNTKKGADTATWRTGAIAGRKQYYKISEKFYLSSSAWVHFGLGKEKYTTDATSDPSLLGQQYDLELLFAELVFEPLTPCYKLSSSSMLELNFFSTRLGYEQKEGSRRGYDNKIDMSTLSLSNNFFSTIQLSFLHTIGKARR